MTCMTLRTQTKMRPISCSMDRFTQDTSPRKSTPHRQSQDLAMPSSPAIPHVGRGEGGNYLLWMDEMVGNTDLAAACECCLLQCFDGFTKGIRWRVKQCSVPYV